MSRTDQQYRSLRDQFKGVAEQADSPCWLCGQKIDWNAKPQSPLAFELDHARPITTHPELELDRFNFRASHSKCNRSRGDAALVVSSRTTTWVPADW